MIIGVLSALFLSFCNELSSAAVGLKYSALLFDFQNLRVGYLPKI